MALRRKKALVLLMFIIIFIYTGLIFISGYKSEFKIYVYLSEEIDYQNILKSKDFPLRFILSTTGHGILSTSADNFYAAVFIEGKYVGKLETANNVITIPLSGEMVEYLKFIQDKSAIPDIDFNSIINTISKYGGEGRLEVIGEIKPKIVFFPYTKSISYSSYIVKERKPIVTRLSWERNSFSLGEKARFYFEVENPYRGTEIQGLLKVEIIEAPLSGSSSVYDTFEYQISLNPGKAQTYSGEFIPLKSSWY